MRNRGKGNEWLLIKKKDADAKPGWNVEDHARSVLTGRTQQEIAENLPATADAALPSRARSPAERRREIAHAAQHSPHARHARRRSRPPATRMALRSEMGRRARPLLHRKQPAPHLLAQPEALRSAISRAERSAALISKPRKRFWTAKSRCWTKTAASSFSLIQPRISVADPNSVAHLSRSTPVTLFLFDLLYLDGYDLRGVPLEERKRLLAEIVTPSDRIRFSDLFTANGDAMLEAARANGLEGILAKRRDSKYEGTPQPRLGQSQSGHHRRFRHRRIHARRARLLQLAGPGRLRWRQTGACRPGGTGFNEKSLKEIYSDIEPLITKKSPFAGPVKALRDVTWVKPRAGGRNQVSGSHSGWIAARAGVHAPAAG